MPGLVYPLGECPALGTREASYRFHVQTESHLREIPLTGCVSETSP